MFLIFLILAAWVACRRNAPMNSIFAIHPYKHEGLWVFDDEAAGLRQEPFVAGSDVIIDRLTESIPTAAKGFTLLFSGAPFPGFHAKLEWKRNEYGGCWYQLADSDLEGWVCPALFRYFDQPPAEIFTQFRAKTN
jgi:hypothetical protein